MDRDRREEIKTVRAREISLLLSDTDVLLLAKRAAAVGLSVPQLLQNFIGDLVYGTYTNGSDEREHANKWLERCGFEYMAEPSFVRHLLWWDKAEHVLNEWKRLNSDRDELKEVKRQLAELASDTDCDWLPETRADVINDLENEIVQLQEEIDYQWSGLNAFLEEYRSGNPKSKVGTLEEEMKSVLAWNDEYQRLLGNSQSSRGEDLVDREEAGTVAPEMETQG